VTNTNIIPMSLSASGSPTTGSKDTITLSSGSDGLGAPYPTGTTSVEFEGTLPVTGETQTAIPLFRHTKAVHSSTFTVSGPLFLTQPGTATIHVPQAFIFILNGPSGTVPILISCKSKSNPSPVGLTLKVTGNAIQPPTTTGTGTPVGAPNTGGGRPASNMPLVAGGAALLAVGAGLAFTARRRRHSEN
jgi:hypothetical protein